jgi:hypothetical protein
MDNIANCISNYIIDGAEEKHPYFDIDDEYDEFSSDEEITARLIEILKSDYLFSDVNLIEMDEPNANHICTIEIVYNEIAYRFTVKIYICSRGYKYLNIM